MYVCICVSFATYRAALLPHHTPGKTVKKAALACITESTHHNETTETRCPSPIDMVEDAARDHGSEIASSRTPSTECLIIMSANPSALDLHRTRELF